MARGASRDLRQRPHVAQETLLVGVEDRHQRHFGQVEPFAQQVHAHQHVEHSGPQVFQNLDAFQRIHVRVDVTVAYAREGYMKRNLREPTINEIASEIGIAKEEIVYAMDAIQTPVSLFDPVYTEGGDSLYVMDQISDKKNKEENWVESISLREAVERLGERERHIIKLRFYEGKTQMEVANEVGISQAQVSRLEKGALKAMRNYLR